MWGVFKSFDLINHLLEFNFSIQVRCRIKGNSIIYGREGFIAFEKFQKNYFKRIILWMYIYNKTELWMWNRRRILGSFALPFCTSFQPLSSPFSWLLITSLLLSLISPIIIATIAIVSLHPVGMATRDIIVGVSRYHAGRFTRSLNSLTSNFAID